MEQEKKGGAFLRTSGCCSRRWALSMKRSVDGRKAAEPLVYQQAGRSTLADPLMRPGSLFGRLTGYDKVGKNQVTSRELGKTKVQGPHSGRFAIFRTPGAARPAPSAGGSLGAPGRQRKRVPFLFL